MSLSDKLARISDWELVPKNPNEMRISWLVVSYVNFAWKEFLVRDTALDFDSFFGFLKFKYKENAESIGRISALE